MAQDAPREGLSIRWGSFSPRKLARFKKLLEKPARKSLRELLSAINERVGKLEEFIEDKKKSKNVLGESIKDLREQSRDFVTMCLTSQRDRMQELLDSQRKKLTDRKDALKAMVKALKEETMATTMALSTRIEELEGELALCLAAMGKRVASVALSYKDVLKPKEFVGIRFACYVDNFL
ncbi:hypothetical protein J1N35_035037 [Gossypium stocksii]|uniref:Uncharacterized protein n=1 Tax=Gossypium stocksii TaxID=47602 RepID=A0A9D3UT81_9ROSI|nr:hypothetical protein J1N35_035037 [Gossypium stocksii]